MRGPTTIAALAAVAMLATGCGDDESGEEPAAGAITTTEAASGGPARDAVTVQMASFKFLPPKVNLTAGGKVTWVNQDKAPHTAENKTVEGPAKFETGRLDLGDRKTVTFTKPGTYTYYCVFHRFMEADVIVK